MVGRVSIRYFDETIRKSFIAPWVVFRTILNTIWTCAVYRVGSMVGSASLKSSKVLINSDVRALITPQAAPNVLLSSLESGGGVRTS